jgi:hypothetical protein
MFEIRWINALRKLFLSGYKDKINKTSKHAGGRQKPKDWREKSAGQEKSPRRRER